MSKIWTVSDLPRLNLEQLRKQAKELVDDYTANDAAAVTFVRSHHPAPPDPFQLSDAQWAIARRLGESSWPALVRRFDERPIVPVRGLVVFPNQRVPLDIGRPRTVAAITAATDGEIVLVAQRAPAVESPARADLFDVGTLARVIHFDGKRAMVEGRRRVRIDEVRERDGMLVATTTPIDAEDPKIDHTAALRSAVTALELLATQMPAIPIEARGLLLPHIHLLPPDVQQRVLETDDPAGWVRALAQALR